MSNHVSPQSPQSPQSPSSAVYLVAIDGSASTDPALDLACRLGAALGGAAELHIVHVVPATPLPMSGTAALPSPGVDLQEAARKTLERTCAGVAGRFNGKVVSHLATGEPWRQIVQLASTLGADLVVVGTAGRTGVARFVLGSVAQKVVRHAGCAVLVARAKDYDAHDEPSIEPPCPDCVAVQKRTQRAEMWCARHATHHVHGHLHYEWPQPFALGTMNLRV
jgi:nucleotide-binding universal stress UspA family protein